MDELTSLLQLNAPPRVKNACRLTKFNNGIGRQENCLNEEPATVAIVQSLFESGDGDAGRKQFPQHHPRYHRTSPRPGRRCPAAGQSTIG